MTRWRRWPTNYYNPYGVIINEFKIYGTPQPEIWSFAEDFKVQTLDGAGWVDQVSVVGNNDIANTIAFNDVTTTGLRVRITKPVDNYYIDMRELEVYNIPTAALVTSGNTPPVALCRDITVPLDDTGNASIIAASVDNGSYDPDPDDVIFLSIDRTAFTCTDLFNPVSVTLTVTDNEGAESSCQATVTVVDNTPPVVTIISPLDEAEFPAYKTIDVVAITSSTVSDNCDSNPVVSVTPSDPVLPPLVNVNLNIDPNVVHLGQAFRKDVVKTQGKPVVTAYLSAMDNPITITVTATDASGNIGSDSVTVYGVLDPATISPDSITIENIENATGPYGIIRSDTQDRDGDGYDDTLMVKFRKVDVSALGFGEVEVTVVGDFGSLGTCLFEATDIITVK
jgi:hypothetical protein